MKKTFLCMLAIATAILAGCTKDEVQRKSVEVNFTATEAGIESDDNSAEINFLLSRVPDAQVSITVNTEGYGVEYGSDFTTSPAANNGQITVTIPAGQTSGSITINKESGISLAGDEYISFTITSVSSADNAAIGSRNSIIARFGTISSGSDEFIIEGNGDENFQYSVYVDFSANRQTRADRKSWNLGFWCGDEFRVVLNGAYSTAATPSDKSDIKDVTLADANAVTDEFNLNTNPMGAMGLSETIFDTPDGSLTGTAFAEISADENENKVYFVASDGDKDNSREMWWKVKVTRKNDGYNVQFGRVNGGDVQSIDIAKDKAYNFVFLSLEKAKTVSAEPQTDKWDMKWSYDLAHAYMGMSSYLMFSQDVLTINTWGGVKVATVMTTDKAYDALTANDIPSLTFSSDREAIGTTWRSTGGMGGSGGVKTDRYYVICDPAGNYYKIRFIRGGFSTTEGGTRGRPELEYELLRPAEE